MLSPRAQQLIDQYISLPFLGVEGVRTPYFINTHTNKRGQIRSLVGKGTPEEIVEESKIISIQYHHGIFDHAGHCCIHRDHHDDKKEDIENIRKFLIDNQLGVDCSGFVTHVLRAHFLDTKNIDIASRLVANIPASLLRKIIMRMRPVESIGVKSGYANDKNTEKLGDENAGYDYTKIKSGDVVIILETGPSKKRNHILLITECDGKTIQYVHARAWAAEGKYGHGVNSGKIKITVPGKGLLAQEWYEQSPALDPNLFHEANANETYHEAKDAGVLEIRRIKI